MHLLYPYQKISTGSDETSSAINILRQYRPSISLDNRLYHYPRIPLTRTYLHFHLRDSHPPYIGRTPIVEFRHQTG